LVCFVVNVALQHSARADSVEGKTMPVMVTCRCGQSFRAIDELAGKVVNCPSCGQPLAIAAREPAPSKSVHAAGDLSDLAGFEQSAAPAAGRPGLAGSDRFATGRPAYAGSQSRTEDGLGRRAIIAIWIGGGVVVLLVLAMVLTSIFDSSDERPDGPLAADAQPHEAQSDDSAVAEAKRPTTSADTSRRADAPDEQSEAADEVVAADADDANPSSVRLDRDVDQQEEERRREAEDDDGASSESASTPSGSSQPSGISIRLSAGTALAQSLPTGTAMGFSVDYRFESGQSDSSTDYLWVIKPSGRQPLKQPVTLQSEGTLQTFVPNLRPGDGPFETHIENQRGVRLSRPLQLR
jgi:hypothetical protein